MALYSVKHLLLLAVAGEQMDLLHLEEVLLLEGLQSQAVPICCVCLSQPNVKAAFNNKV
jgi:hypothetical protein